MRDPVIHVPSPTEGVPNAVREPELTSDELRGVVDSMRDIVVCLDARRRCSYISPSAWRVFGYRVEDLLGTDLLQVIHPDDLAAVVARFADAQAKAKAHASANAKASANRRPEPPADAIELRLRHAVTGEYIAGEVSYRRLQDSAGHRTGVVLSWRDTTNRKRAENALLEAQTRYREVFDTAREVIFQTAISGNWRLLSPSWKALTGYDVEESLGRHLLEVVHPGDRQRIVTATRSLLAHECASLRETIRMRTKAGRTRWVELSTSLSHDRDGQDTGGAGTLDDVTSGYINTSLADIGRTMDSSVLEGAAVDVLAQRVCDGLVASMRHPLAWVGLANKDGTVRVAGRAGRLAGVLDGASLRWDDTPEGATPIGLAVRTRTTQLESTAALKGVPTCDRAAAAGIAGVVVIPLLAAGSTLGTLCIGTESTGDLDAEQIRALEPFAGKLSLALQLAQHQALLALQAAAMASSANALFITGPTGRIEWVNAAFEQMSMYSKEDAVGHTPRFLQSGLEPPETFAEMWRVVNAGGTWRDEIVNRRKDGATYVVAQTVTPLFDEHRVLTHLVAAHEDITARSAAEARVSHMAEHDTLTGLANRTLLQTRLMLALSEEREPLALLFLDLDRFKMVNDTLGHAAGDQLLRVVAERIRACVREQDVVARQGGDEFIVLLTSVATQTAATQAAQRIVESIGRPMKIDGQDVHVSASIGVALSPQGSHDAESLIKQADAAMYQAKQAGRNGVVFYTADLDCAKSSALTIQAGLARAIARGELSLAYQPQVDVPSGRIVGLEALLRWTSPELGVVSPAEFIPVAEATGLIVDIDRWVIRAACAQRRAWELEGLDAPRVAVNVSGVSFRRADLLPNVEQALRDAQLAAKHLEIEVTEGVVMYDAPTVIKTLDAFRKMGVRIALDDFGTGYSSLSYLKRFKIDALKIDRSFVTGLPDNADDAALARLIVSMATVLGMSTIAEGVETHEQASFLRSIGCTTAQGFLFSPAVRPAAVADLLRRSTLELAA